jgi:hypothetical protein
MKVTRKAPKGKGPTEKCGICGKKTTMIVSVEYGQEEFNVCKSCADAVKSGDDFEGQEELIEKALDIKFGNYYNERRVLIRLSFAPGRILRGNKKDGYTAYRADGSQVHLVHNCAGREVSRKMPQSEIDHMVKQGLIEEKWISGKKDGYVITYKGMQAFRVVGLGRGHSEYIDKKEYEESVKRAKKYSYSSSNDRDDFNMCDARYHDG